MVGSGTRTLAEEARADDGGGHRDPGADYGGRLPFEGKNTAIIEEARKVRPTTEMSRPTWRARTSRSTDSSSSRWPRPGGRPLGHPAKLNERAGNADLRELTDWAVPIQQRHLQEVLDGSLKLAAAEDPNEEE